MPDRRPLSFSGLRDVADEIGRLRAGAHARCGRWSLDQICRHLDASLTFAMRPGPHPANTPQQDANRAMFEQVLASGRLPSGIEAPPAFVPPDDADGSAVDALLVTLRRFDEFPGPFGPHRLFGNLTRDEMRTLAMIHCAHHLSHLVPVTTTTTTTSAAAGPSPSH